MFPEVVRRNEGIHLAYKDPGFGRREVGDAGTRRHGDASPYSKIPRQKVKSYFDTSFAKASSAARQASAS